MPIGSVFTLEGTNVATTGRLRKTQRKSKQFDNRHLAKGVNVRSAVSSLNTSRSQPSCRGVYNAHVHLYAQPQSQGQFSHASATLDWIAGNSYFP